MADINRRGDGEGRLLAALAHASIVAQGLGIIVGVLVYLTQRDKSRYAAFQGLQAAVFQMVGLVAIVGLWFVWGIFYALTWIPLIPLMEASPDAAPPPIFWVGIGSMVIPLALMAVVGLYGLWGALRCWQGRDFRYAIVGPLLERSGLWQNEPPAPLGEVGL